jgi:ribosome maturation factor RimP
MSETLTQKLIELISPLVKPMGYEVVHLEVIPRQKLLRLFIDHLDRTDGIGIEDCVKVTHALNEPLDAMTEVDGAFGGGTYELEVSSPGIDRPLRTQHDFEKFKGREVRIHTFRALSGEELGNVDYQAKNPKQKNFLGTLQGVREDKVLLALNLTGGHDKAQKKLGKKAKQDASAGTNSAEVAIPLPLISKANLEPDLEVLERA